MNRSWDATRRQGFYLLLSNVLLAGVVTFLAIDKLTQHERLVLVPPHVDQKMSVSWNSANAEYLKSFGLYFASLTANVTPKSVDFLADQIGSYVAPRIFPDVQKRLRMLAADPVFTKSGASVQFEPTNVAFEPETNKVFVVGNVTTYAPQGKSERVSVVYEMVIRMFNGRPMVEAMENYPGNQPRTLKWIGGQGANWEKAQREIDEKNRREAERLAEAQVQQRQAAPAEAAPPLPQPPVSQPAPAGQPGVSSLVAPPPTAPMAAPQSVQPPSVSGLPRVAPVQSATAQPAQAAPAPAPARTPFDKYMK